MQRDTHTVLYFSDIVGYINFSSVFSFSVRIQKSKKQTCMNLFTISIYLNEKGSVNRAKNIHFTCYVPLFCAAQTDVEE